MLRLNAVTRWGLVLLLSAALGAGAQAPDLDAMDIVLRSLPPGPVAFVEGESISREEFLDLYNLHLAALRERGDANPSDDTRVKAAIAALSELSQEALLYAEAKRRNISVSDAKVSEAYAAELKRMQDLAVAEGLPRPSEADILKEGGQTAEEVRDSIRKKLMMLEARNAMVAAEKIEVTDAEVAEFLKNRPEVASTPESVHLKQILVRPSASPASASEAQWTTARQRIDKALARIRAGERFETVARDVSDAPDAERGGDLGLLPVQEGRGGIPPFFLDAVRTLKPGELSAVFRSEFGWHLLKLEARNAAGTQPAGDAATRVREFLKAAKSERALDAILQPMLQDSERVRIYMQLPRSIAAQMRSTDTAQ